MAKRGFKVIDSELHIQEPFDLWEKRLEEPYRSRTKVQPPEHGHLEQGAGAYEINGHATHARPSGVRQQSLRHLPEVPNLVAANTLGTPEVYLEGMDIEGIDVAILTPTQAMHVMNIDGADPEHALALCRVYNDYAYEFSQASPDRFKCLAWIPRQVPELAAQEARRCVERLGAVGAAMTNGAVDGHLLSDPFFDPLWEELNRLGVPLGIHVFGKAGMRDDVRARFDGHRISGLLSNTLTQTFHAQACLTELILGGVLERYPSMKPVVMESNVSWLPWLLWRMDEKWELYGQDQDYTLSLRPSEYFRRQCFAVIDPGEEPLRLVIDYLGDDNLLFSSDYPHHDSAFPEAVNLVLALQGVSDESKRKICWDNGARLFGLEVPSAAG